MIFNIIQGHIFEAFANERKDSNQRKDIIDNECFVCGITRKEYLNLNLATEYMSFDEHREKGHDHWGYLYYMNYVNNKVRYFVRNPLSTAAQLMRQWHQTHGFDLVEFVYQLGMSF